MSNLDERVLREQVAHTEDDVLNESYRLKNKFPHIYSYPSRQKLNNTIDEIIENIEGKHILDFGCGNGSESLKYLQNGAITVGIDISSKYIEKCNQEASKMFKAENYEFLVMDAHNLTFQNNSFDLVIGNGILHHLELFIALEEVHRVLKPGGRAVFFEPLADNPLLKLFRLITPKARTIDEQPLTKLSLESIIEDPCWTSECAYCGLIEAPTALVTSIIFPNNIDNILLRTASRIETYFHKKAWLNSWNQYVQINLIKN